MKKLIFKGREYEIDPNGVIVQTDVKPFTYDAKYSAIYDSPEYMRNSHQLQAIRFGFVSASHGKVINKIIDIGYGNGAFMSYVKYLVPQVCGFDITGVPVPDGCRKLETLEGADVVTMFDVMEHFPVLDDVRGLDCETLVVSLPWCHYNSLGPKEGKVFMEKDYKHLKPDEHIRHFDRVSLTVTMATLGWREVASGFPEDMIRKSAHGLPNILTMAFKRF